MEYRFYIETDVVEKVDDSLSYDDMMFALAYLIRVRGWKKRILIIEHDIENDIDSVFYQYNGDIDEYMNWWYGESGKVKKL